MKHLSPIIQNIGESNHEYPLTGRKDAERSILLWKFARRINSANEQTVSRFVGWVIKLHGKENSKKTDRLSPVYKKSNYGVQYRVGMHYSISSTYQSKQYEVHTLLQMLVLLGIFSGYLEQFS